MEPPSSRRGSTRDDSTLVRHNHFHDPHITKLELGLELWAHNTGLSRSEYTSLRQILALVKDPSVHELPESLASLKRRVTKDLPLLDMRTKRIPLISEKLATATSTEKAKGNKGGIPRESLHLFDPAFLFRTFTSSDIADKMHIGLAEYRDFPTQLYHSRCWSSSIRTTSGQYAHFNNGEGDPIFPSDFVRYQCHDAECVRCLGENWHIGRVMSVTRDYSSYAQLEGAITLELREIFKAESIINFEVFAPTLLPNEVVMSWEHVINVLESHIKGSEWYYSCRS